MKGLVECIKESLLLEKRKFDYYGEEPSDKNTITIFRAQALADKYRVGESMANNFIFRHVILPSDPKHEYQTVNCYTDWSGSAREDGTRPLLWRLESLDNLPDKGVLPAEEPLYVNFTVHTSATTTKATLCKTMSELEKVLKETMKNIR